MSRVRTPQELEAWRESIQRGINPDRPQLRVCGGTGCRSMGGPKLWDALQRALEGAGLQGQVEVVITGCHGFCERGPLVTVEPQGIAYQQVAPGDAQAIVTETLKAGRVIEELLYVDPSRGERILYEADIPFYKHQARRLLALNGKIDPRRIQDYIAHDGYQALSKALYEMDPEGVIQEVSHSQLRGRGGAGFPTGLKWKLCRHEPGHVKYIICNADEGDPGAFMDRSILEANPHSVVEGMIIGAYAMGATQGYVYIRNEYPLAVQNLKIALGQAQEHGLLGENILGSGFDFDIEVRVGSGAFVCGEETALMASIEGKIGEPQPRPPYPAQRGLWGKPTNINNVKTWANIPLIIKNGSAWFANVGTEKSKGTMIFSLVGKICNTGLVEVPMGISLHELIYDVGGGIPGGKEFKAAQIGGPSGGCIPRAHLDVPIDYESLMALGAIVGSGGLVVTDQNTCMVDLARYFLKFTQEESCGKCVPCRIGTQAMLETLECICAGRGRQGDIEYLVEIGQEVKRASLCGLGQTAPNPVLTTIRYFRDEYEAHVYEHRCPAKVCKGLITYEVVAELCTGCMVCTRNCPTGAISGEKGQPHTINVDVCTRCGVCQSFCKFNAIVVH